MIVPRQRFALISTEIASAIDQGTKAELRGVRTSDVSDQNVSATPNTSSSFLVRVESEANVDPIQRVNRSSGLSLILKSSTSRSPTPNTAPGRFRADATAGVLLEAVAPSG